MSSISLSEILTRERNRLSEKKANIDTTLAAQGRLMTLNDSYRKRYSRYTQMIAVFVFATIGFLIVSALPRVAPFIPKLVVDVLSLAVVLIAAYMIFTMYMEINSRSNTNYDELDIPPSVDVSGNLTSLDLGQKETTEWSMGDISELLAKYSINTCFGGDCCPDGYIYNAAQNKCVEAATAGGAAASPPTSPPPTPPTPPTPPAQSGQSGFTTLNDVLPGSLGTPAPVGQQFSTVGEKYVESRFLAPPIH
jgi:hypothetical protein